MTTSTGQTPQAAESPNSEAAVFWLQVLIVGSFIGILGLVIVSMTHQRKDYAALFDQQVESGWMSDRELINASEFFAKGGIFENSSPTGAAAQIDQKFVIPLIDRLRDEHHLEAQVIVEESDPQRAHAMIVQVPSDRETRNAIRKTVLEMADTFPGLLYQHWGRQWLTLDFFDEHEITPMIDAGVLTKIKAGQRRME